MTVKEAFYRGNNLLATAIVGLAGFSFLPEFFLEDEKEHKIDDGLLFVLGIGAIIWFLLGKHKYTRSFVPVAFVIASFIVKIGGLLIEIKDKEDVGDDFGGLILFALATILVLVLYFKGKKVKEG